MQQPLITLSNAIIKAGSNTISHDLTMDIFPGENWAVVGNSGAGKSVLLQAIAGNLVLSGGSIGYHFKNEDGSEALNYHPFIAFVGARQHFKNLSNTVNFYYQQRYNSSDSEDARTVSQYLTNIAGSQPTTNRWTLPKVTADLNLNNLLNKQIIKLSNGETKRLMLAAALLKNPKLLLLDNPLTGLDVDTRTYFNELLRKIKASGITVVMATSPYELPDMIDNVLVLEAGMPAKTCKKEQFDAINAGLDNKAVLDTSALLQLLSANARDNDFKQIAAMRNVNIKYGEKQVLHNINWEIKPSERWALLGPNGAGKSTLLSLINGDNPQAYANDITLFDRKRGSGESIWDIKRKIGFVSPELYQYFPTDNSCLQVIESGFYDTLGLFRPSVKSRADLALSWMKALEIDKYARMHLKNLPASAQRLCLLARALVKNPALLIFDEPCQGLDDHQQQRFKAIVDTLCSVSNVTLIYVTHYQHEIPESVGKVLRLDKGEVVV